MKNLAVDTSSNICSVAILENDELIAEIDLDNGKTHSENFMPIIDEILQKNNLKLSDIELISCVVGPGSFTGIRIGVATVKALAESKKIPIASVTSLETIAGIDDGSLDKVVLIDAQNNQVYCGIFDRNYNALEESFADDIENAIKVIKKYKNFVCIGNGAKLHRKLLIERLDEAVFFTENEQRAEYAGKIGYRKYQKNMLETADTLAPIYLKQSQAERLKK